MDEKSIMVMFRMICDLCREAGETEETPYNRAKWIFVDDIGNHQIKLICDRHRDEIANLFGEFNITIFDIDFEVTPTFLQLIHEINEKLKWHEDMRKKLYQEIKKIKGRLKNVKDNPKTSYIL